MSILFNVSGYEGSCHFDLFVIRNAPVEKFADADESCECADYLFFPSLPNLFLHKKLLSTS